MASHHFVEVEASRLRLRLLVGESLFGGADSGVQGGSATRGLPLSAGAPSFEIVSLGRRPTPADWCLALFGVH